MIGLKIKGVPYVRLHILSCKEHMQQLVDDSRERKRKRAKLYIDKINPNTEGGHIMPTPCSF